jgi:chemotaxis protein MotB
MNRYLRVFTVVAVSAAIGGCVSTGTYEKMEADKNQEIANLQKDKASLQNDIATLEQQKAVLQTTSQQRQAQYDALVQKLSSEVQQGRLKVRQYQNMLSVDVAEQIFFDSGRAELKDSGKVVLNTIAEALKSYDNKIIRVAGYTDNVPIAKAMQNVYPSNWELSVARATNVVRFLQDAGVPPERMVASGRGEYAPVAPNDTPEGRQKNRRIEIMLIDHTLAEEIGKPKP